MPTSYWSVTQHAAACRRSRSARSAAASALAEPYGAGVLGGSLAVGTELVGSLPGPRCVGEHRGRVACRLRVVCEPREIGTIVRRVGERFEDAPVEIEPPVGRHRLLHRDARQLVAEDDVRPVHGQHPAPETLVEVLDPGSREPVEQPRLDVRRRKRDELEQPCAPAERRPARASTASRTVGGNSSAPEASASTTKNGFPAVSRYSSPASAPCGSARAATASAESGCKPDALDGSIRRELSEQLPERMRRARARRRDA